MLFCDHVFSLSSRILCLPNWVWHFHICSKHKKRSLFLRIYTSILKYYIFRLNIQNTCAPKHLTVSLYPDKLFNPIVMNWKITSVGFMQITDYKITGNIIINWMHNKVQFLYDLHNFWYVFFSDFDFHGLWIIWLNLSLYTECSLFIWFGNFLFQFWIVYRECLVLYSGLALCKHIIRHWRSYDVFFLCVCLMWTRHVILPLIDWEFPGFTFKWCWTQVQ